MQKARTERVWTHYSRRIETRRPRLKAGYNEP
jgi:hypothetical protein